MNETLKNSELLIDKVISKLVDFGFDYGPKLIGALIILIGGVIVAKWVCGSVGKWLDKADMEPPLKKLISRVIWLLVMALTMMLVLDKIGVPIAPFVAGVGVAGVGIGLAMQGVLGNLVAGLVIIFTKPFRVGEYIELLGVQGQVLSIDLFSTVLVHADQSRVMVPNRKIVGEIMHNYRTIRQADLVVGVTYGTDPNAALTAVQHVLAANPRVLKDPAPFVGIVSLGDFSVNIAIKPWVKVADFGPTQAEINKAVLEEFKLRGIEIPFPQREVRVLNLPPRAA